MLSMTRAFALAVSLLAVFTFRVPAASFFTATPFSYAVGTNLISVAVADLNLDGWPDIVAALSSDPNLRVLTNNADGTFAPAPPIPAVVCDKVIAQDVNGDARPDLILLRNGGPGSMFVYTNAGNSFAFASSNAPGFVDANGFTTADLNGDGWNEILTVNGGPIQAYTNNHLGTFTHSADAYANGFYPWAIAADDLDNNGTPDLLVSHWEDRPVLMTNNGSGVLYFARFFEGFGGPLTPRVADMNHDGLIDCLFNGALMTNNGGGTFTAANATNLAGPGASILALADLDGDGWTEVVASGIDVRTNNHLHVFSSMVNIPVSPSAREAVIADVDRNGRSDVITASGPSSPGSISVVLNYAQLPLAIRPDGPGGPGVVITWPHTQPAMFLEAADHLGPAPVNWSPVVAFTNAAGTHREALVPASAPMQFFRLHD